MTTHCSEYGLLTRRSFLSGGMANIAGLAFGRNLVNMPTWMPDIALADAQQGQRGDTLVCIFLRGGSDGLNMVVPFGDNDYYEARPNLAIGRPDQASASSQAVDLDGFFGLHPMLQPLHNVYSAGDLALIHATGAPHDSRSHFVAQASMEQGMSSDYTGWLSRHLATLDTGNASSLRAVGVGDLLAMSLTGPARATLMPSLDAYSLSVPARLNDPVEAVLQNIYANQQGLLTVAAEQTLATLDIVASVNGSSRASYGNNKLGKGLETVAQLIKAQVGVEVACVDFGGWDTHAQQGAGEGQMAGLMATLSAELMTFYDDLQEQMSNVTVVVMSEFGRRVGENGSGGTDHGQGNAMFLMGGGVNGGQVFANWPGLATSQLDDGDLAITTDYRDILGELLQKRLNDPLVNSVFPSHNLTSHGIFV